MISSFSDFLVINLFFSIVLRHRVSALLSNVFLFFWNSLKWVFPINKSLSMCSVHLLLMSFIASSTGFLSYFFS